MNENNLKACREELNITQKELGKSLGLSEFTISGWENFHDNIPLSKLVDFCNKYDFNIDYVIGLTRINKKHNNQIKLNKNKIKNNLKNIRLERNLSQKEIANSCSISQTTYSNYECGINLITTTTLFILCKTYKLKVSDILN